MEAVENPPPSSPAPSAPAATAEAEATTTLLREPTPSRPPKGSSPVSPGTPAGGGGGGGEAEEEAEAEAGEEAFAPPPSSATSSRTSPRATSSSSAGREAREDEEGFGLPPAFPSGEGGPPKARQRTRLMAVSSPIPEGEGEGAAEGGRPAPLLDLSSEEDDEDDDDDKRPSPEKQAIHRIRPGDEPARSPSAVEEEKRHSDAMLLASLSDAERSPKTKAEEEADASAVDVAVERLDREEERRRRKQQQRRGSEGGGGGGGRRTPAGSSSSQAPTPLRSNASAVQPVVRPYALLPKPGPGFPGGPGKRGGKRDEGRDAPSVAAAPAPSQSPDRRDPKATEAKAKHDRGGQREAAGQRGERTAGARERPSHPTHRPKVRAPQPQAAHPGYLHPGYPYPPGPYGHPSSGGGPYGAPPPSRHHPAYPPGYPYPPGPYGYGAPPPPPPGGPPTHAPMAHAPYHPSSSGAGYYAQPPPGPPPPPSSSSASQSQAPGGSSAGPAAAVVAPTPERWGQYYSPEGGQKPDPSSSEGRPEPVRSASKGAPSSSGGGYGTGGGGGGGYPPHGGQVPPYHPLSGASAASHVVPSEDPDAYPPPPGGPYGAPPPPGYPPEYYRDPYPEAGPPPGVEAYAAVSRDENSPTRTSPARSSGSRQRGEEGDPNTPPRSSSSAPHPYDPYRGDPSSQGPPSGGYGAPPPGYHPDTPPGSYSHYGRPPPPPPSTSSASRDPYEPYDYTAPSPSEGRYHVPPSVSDEAVDPSLTAPSSSGRPSPTRAPYHQFSKGGRSVHSEPVILRKKFSWRNYPELEEYLIANRADYLHHSALNYTAEQKHFNNRLTEGLLELAAKLNYVFDEACFNFVAVRDRIRCYYKSFVQSSKKRGVVVGFGKGAKRTKREGGEVPEDV
ncbi:hypothetical protein ACHAWF_017246 [Thalassiosira exigua]